MPVIAGKHAAVMNIQASSTQHASFCLEQLHPKTLWAPTKLQQVFEDPFWGLLSQKHSRLGDASHRQMTGASETWEAWELPLASESVKQLLVTLLLLRNQTGITKLALLSRRKW